MPRMVLLDCPKHMLRHQVGLDWAMLFKHLSCVLREAWACRVYEREIRACKMGHKIQRMQALM